MKALLIVLVVIFLALQYHLWFADDGLLHIFQLKKEIEIQEAKNQGIIKHNASLKREIDSLKEGGDAIETCARGDLGMVKEGEIFYQVVK